MTTDRQKAQAAARTRAAWARKTPEERKFDARRHGLWQHYKLTINAFDKMLDDQDGCCAICGTTEPGGRGWHVDHDHATGKNRGLLCTNCNVGIGHFKDTPALLELAASYLRLHSGSS